MRGKGEDFCLTDLVAIGFGTCLLTMRGINARKEKWSLQCLKLEVNKKMSSIGARKIQILLVKILSPQISLIIN